MPAESRAAFSARGSVEGGAANCVFCAIVEGETSATEVYRDDDFVAFLDAHPVFPGHVLMVPRRHVQTYDELPEDLAGPWLRASQALVRGAKARALMHGRFNVSVKDIQALAKPILRHRVMTNFYAESERINADAVVERLLDAVPVPKSGM